MAQTLSDLLDVTRSLILDSRAGVTPRHSDAKLISYLNMALADAKRLRPDLFIPGYATKEFAYTDSVGDLATDFPLEWMYAPPFIEYMAGMASLEEDEYVAEGRAAALLARFGAKLTGRAM